MNKLDFKEVLSTDPVYKYVRQLLTDHLSKGEKVLWLLSGGSAIGIETEVAKRLPASVNLTAALIDERYGPKGHPDSNWKQLEDAGFNPAGAKLIPLLGNKSLEKTARDYSLTMGDLLQKSDFVIAMAGIGADGHTLGIKPNSPAVNSSELAVGYDWDDYLRITTTAEVIKRCDKIVVYAAGAEKKNQLQDLKRSVSPNDQPAQLLKLCRDVTVFTDQIV